ncbi:MAG: helix-turn-helix domain-containing protein [Chitinophagaceae bacterium]
MEMFIPTEADFRKWIKESVQETFAEMMRDGKKGYKDESLLSRKEIAAVLKISLVTLTDWVKRGLPCHKQRGRVYFLRTEVLAYLKDHSLQRFKFSSRFEKND